MASDKRDLAELQRQVAEAKQARLAEMERADRLMLQADLAPTNLERYLQLVQQCLVPMLSIKSNPNQTSSGSVSSVDRMYYPLELYVWADFPEKHNEMFGQFMNLLSDKSLFPSEAHVLAVQSELSLEPGTAYIHPGRVVQDIRPFVETAIEKPTYRVLKAYLGQSGKADRFCFWDKAYGLENRTFEHNNIQPIPDCWGIYETSSGNIRHVCVGKYNAAPKIHTEEIIQVLTSPSVELFLEVLHRKQSGIVNSDIEKSREEVAQILCQTFHYMITSGLLYGYVALREILIFLKIEKSSPQKLYFYLTRVVTKPPREFEVRDTPAAQLATFATVALRSKEMSPDWITKAQNCGICRWPLLPPSPLIRDVALRPRGIDEETSESSEEEEEDDDDDEGPGDSNYNPPTKRRAKARSEPNQQTSQRRQSTRKQNVTRRPILPYCTQACLLGLVNALPLDLSCPNATLHQQGQACKKHLITKEDLCSLTKKQLACSLDEDCECLDREGLYGRIGVLFKITLTKYGYTFVAKGVQVVDESDLAHEACVYAQLSHLQGMKVPVFLGNITLEQPYPLVSLARVTQMMLMSWAGRRVREKSCPKDVNIKKEEEEILHELASSGIIHHDMSTANLVWNPEQKQVMAIDFDQAAIHRTQKRKAKRKASTSPLASPRRKMIGNGGEQKTPAASPPEMREFGKDNMDPASLED
ncbi:hypothetical protein EMPG_12577 [Blastomyces silverae]|uniref:Protein kinase domain-containing protein n=1 Tax=Blastomyces silverae TaxID=2060906 RepID=A0A0H1BN11_9EURO|nr:hypothetical protein EMPG_12577 [Blastomyces silverae]